MTRRSTHRTSTTSPRHSAPRHDPAPLLMASGLSDEAVAKLLSPYGLTDHKRADADLQSIAGDPRERVLLAKILPELLHALAQTADPDQGLVHWDRFLQAGINRAQLFEYLAGLPRMTHLLCTIFGNSPAMADTLIRTPMLVYWLAEQGVLSRRPSRTELANTLKNILINVMATDLKLDALRRFRRREMLRIGVRDLLKLADVQETTAALTDLACILIQAACDIASATLRDGHDRSIHTSRKGKSVETGFVVIAMGKLGGGELNYSSDVDLLYVYEPEKRQATSRAGRSVTTQRLSQEEYFEYLARDLTKALTETTAEGHVFRVDLRLRAEGTTGQLARSLDGYEHYYRTRGEEWERLALLKAWPVAGDLSLGRRFLRRIDPFVFGRSDGPQKAGDVLMQIRLVKEKIDDKVSGRGQARRHVKLGVGGIREIEFIVQAAQVLCGKKTPAIRDRSTMGALRKLARRGLLTAKERDDLTRAYLFLRDVEHKLQMVHDLQTHTLPESMDDLARCAIRLGYPAQNRQRAADMLLADHDRHTANVHRMFQRVFATPAHSPLVRAVGGKRSPVRRT